ncbi:AAA family ATPase, partial [Thermodesulfitimonas sp.]
MAAGIPAVLEALREGADYVLMDTPPVLNAAVARVLDLADEIVVVGQTDVVALRRLKADVEFLNMHQLGEKIRVVLNNASFGGGLKLADVERSLGLQRLDVISADPKTAHAAANKGIPFVALSKGSRVAQDVIRLAEKFVAKEVPAKSERRSLFGKL